MIKIHSEKDIQQGDGGSRSLLHGPGGSWYKSCSYFFMRREPTKTIAGDQQVEVTNTASVSIDDLVYTHHLIWYERPKGWGSVRTTN